MSTLTANVSATEAAGGIDLRGIHVPTSGGAAVLEDPTGRRKIQMRRLGRAVATLLALWLGVLLLGGLGLFPVGGIPLAGLLKPPTKPPPLARHALQSHLPQGTVASTRTTAAGVASGSHSTGLPSGRTARGRVGTSTRPSQPGVFRRTSSSTRSTTRPTQAPSNGSSRGTRSTAPAVSKPPSTHVPPTHVPSVGRTIARGQVKKPTTSHTGSGVAPGRIKAPASSLGASNSAPGQSFITPGSLRSAVKR